jgi:hypothetical protein
MDGSPAAKLTTEASEGEESKGDDESSGSDTDGLGDEAASDKQSHAEVAASAECVVDTPTRVCRESPLLLQPAPASTSGNAGEASNGLSGVSASHDWEAIARRMADVPCCSVEYLRPHPALVTGAGNPCCTFVSEVKEAPRPVHYISLDSTSLTTSILQQHCVAYSPEMLMEECITRLKAGLRDYAR